MKHSMLMVWEVTSPNFSTGRRQNNTFSLFQFFFGDGGARNGEKNFGPNCPEIVSRGDHGSAIHPVPPKKGFSDLKVSL